ncbi:hypothetical protein ADK34_05815 [Streptomyces viridochromogenes]|uniref:Uncharacterized protein n=1 Tax=Streptomyces viridochromogenes TaxID=1938 RepID=A0A0L8LAE1_STRVR|nr:hypothetical protein ADK34_05815 [Streptomyces viridochromogenes]
MRGLRPGLLARRPPRPPGGDRLRRGTGVRRREDRLTARARARAPAPAPAPAPVSRGRRRAAARSVRHSPRRSAACGR